MLFIDGKDINTIPLKTLRENIGYVPQDNFLFSDTLKSNIAFGAENDDMEAIQSATRAACIHENIVQFPDGYETIVGERGVTLSGGQKQRISIARVFLKNPPILILDEATSALDPQTTSSILKLLEEINRNLQITIVIITHQMSVVREICTKVAILKDGEVVEEGSVEEIFNHPKSKVAKELILTDGSQETDLKPLIQSGDKVRIVFSENSAFEPVIANMILKFHEPVNILKADTKNVGGVAKGEMILQFPGDSEKAEAMKQYLRERGLAIGEVTDSVD